MKKIYKTPELSKVNLYSEDSFLTASKDPHQSGSIYDGTEIGSGTGTSGDHSDAKTSGRFWDDEE